MTDEPERVDARDSMTRGERVRAAARTLRTPQSAVLVADETDTSVKTTRKYLDQRVEDNVLGTDENGDRTRYVVDCLMATYREVATLQREHDREQLTDALESMRSDVTAFQATYDVETPGQLRASIVDVNDPDEVEKRRFVSSEWEHLADRIPVVRAALAEYDWAAERDAPSV